MRGKGFLVGILIIITLFQCPAPVIAGRSSSTLKWENGLAINMLVENNDFWTTDVTSEIFFLLTLTDDADVAEFRYLIFGVWLVTTIVDYAELVVSTPFAEVGDAVRLKAQFHITPEEINNAEWDTFRGHFFYNFSLGVTLSNGETYELYTRTREGTPLTISTVAFIVYWPFPMIILMGSIYWVAYLFVRRINSRYAGFKELEKKERWW